jgi:hypothetical protein
MKKVLGFVLTASLAFGALAACASGGGGTTAAAAAAQERKVPSSVPEFVKAALRSVPEDALVGVGTAKLASTSQSMTVAQTRARADISRQISTIIKDMVNDYTASSEVDTSAAIGFQETVTQALSKSTLSGAGVAAIDTAPDGSFWAVVQMSKSDVGKEINQQANAAKLNAPKMAAFDAQARMDKAFDKISGAEVQVVSQ